MWRRIPATGARHATSFRTKAAYATAGATTLALSGYYYNFKQHQQQRLLDDTFEYPPQSSMIYLEPQQAARDPTRPHAFWAPPSREDMIRMLQEGPGAILKEKTIAAAAAAAAASETPGSNSAGAPPVVAVPTTPVEDEDVFDLLIIGGGATGAGCAVDAATRGLKVAMVERDDFSSGKLLFSLSDLFLLLLCACYSDPGNALDALTFEWTSHLALKREEGDKKPKKVLLSGRVGAEVRVLPKRGTCGAVKEGKTKLNQRQRKKTHSHAPAVKGMSLLFGGNFCSNWGSLSELEATTRTLGRKMTPL